MTQSPTEYQHYTEHIDGVSEASSSVQGYSVQYSVMHKGTVMHTESSISYINRHSQGYTYTNHYTGKVLHVYSRIHIIYFPA